MACCWPILVVLLVLAWPLARWIDAVMDGRFAWARASRRRCTGCAASRPDAEMGWLQYALAILVFNGLGVLVGLRAAAAAGGAAAQPAGHGGGDARLVVQHRHQLRHQHQLAGLRRRVDDELPHADARPGGAELPVGRHRHRRRDRADPRLRAPQRRRAIGNCVGRPDARHAVGAAAAVVRVRAVPRAARASIQNFDAYKEVHDARDGQATRSPSSAPTASR